MSMSREEALQGQYDGRYPDLRQRCAWPEGEFSFHDEPGEHDPCYVVMPDGAMLTVNHRADEGVDVARAKFIVGACNEALTPDALRESLQATYNDLLALQDQTDTVPLATALDAVALALRTTPAVTSNERKG